MKVLIKAVEVGAEYEGKIYDFWVECVLKDGQTIRVFDSKPFDLRNRLGHALDCLIQCSFFTPLHEGASIEAIHGKVIGAVELSPSYGLEPDDLSKWWTGFETKNGVFLLPDDETVDMPCQGSVALEVSRFDLIGYAQDNWSGQ